MTRVVVVDEAERQLRAIDEWWVANRELAPELLVEEFSRCVMLLENTPDVGARFLRTSIPVVRHLLMKKTRHALYYVSLR